jgi:putative proteasome-type protease
MTYCVGLLLDAGIVMLSDTRTNAGVDNIACYRKMYAFEAPGERVMTLMTSGNLSVTQTAIAKLEHAIADPEATPETSIMQAETMLGVAEIVGRTLNAVSAAIGERMGRTNHSASALMLVGGQRRGGQMRLFLVYPEGNFIEATEDTPYLQIGEHKYGKPILDRVVTRKTTLEEGRKVVLISMDSTLRSNLSVGMPLDLLTIRRDAFRVERRERIMAGDAEFTTLSEAWSRALREGFAALP